MTPHGCLWRVFTWDIGVYRCLSNSFYGAFYLVAPASCNSSCCWCRLVLWLFVPLSCDADSSCRGPHATHFTYYLWGVRCGRGWLVDRRYVHRTPAVYLPGQREGEVEGMGNGDVFNQRSPRSTVHGSSCPLVRLACQAKTSGDHPFNEALITVFITKGDYQSKPTTPDTTAIRPSI